MSGYVPDASALRGLTVGTAECYGKPHLGCEYRGAGIGDNRLLDGARCAVCGAPASNSHHAPPRSKGTLALATPNGSWTLRPALIAVCGSGTTGCHGDLHGGARLSVRWEWDGEDAARAWWEGELLAGDYKPHDPGLYGLGCWVVTDTRTGRRRTRRPHGKEASAWQLRF